jgi:hypothetical protein
MVLNLLIIKQTAVFHLRPKGYLRQPEDSVAHISRTKTYFDFESQFVEPRDNILLLSCSLSALCPLAAGELKGVDFSPT